MLIIENRTFICFAVCLQWVFFFLISIFNLIVILVLCCFLYFFDCFTLSCIYLGGFKARATDLHATANQRRISRQIQWKWIQHVKAVWTPLSRCHPLHPPSPHPHFTSIHSSATLAFLHLTSQEWNRNETSCWWWSSSVTVRKCSSLPVHPPMFSSIHPSIRHVVFP